MGLFDKLRSGKLKDRASDVAGKHGDKITDGVDKATDAIDDKTGGKFTDKLDSADDKAADAVDRLAKEDEA